MIDLPALLWAFRGALCAGRRCALLGRAPFRRIGFIGLAALIRGPGRRHTTGRSSIGSLCSFGGHQSWAASGRAVLGVVRGRRAGLRQRAERSQQQRIASSTFAGRTRGAVCGGGGGELEDCECRSGTRERLRIWRNGGAKICRWAEVAAPLYLMSLHVYLARP
ncbi:hypothetical protein BU16DRAFT_321921 [Lophium mytilinum]|uniref:Uncharacterized protein n=1 Tax=Lophium mytilinum TaxID=390894 RepID=A0A6A6R182_9PEZI|nr:hypothetical protein BU16DRAFT_321921 [Lophium mytilinum]